MRIGRGEDDAPARARADHREQTPFIGQAPAVDLGASDDAVERAEIEHRLGPGQAREVALERVEDDHGVELATGGRVRGQHVDLVVVGVGGGCEARRPLRRIERQQEGFGRRVGGGARRGDGVRELDHGVEVDERVMVALGSRHQVGRERQLEPEDAEGVEDRRCDGFGPREDAGELRQGLRVIGVGELVHRERVPRRATVCARESEQRSDRRRRQTPELGGQDRFDQRVALLRAGHEPTQAEDERPGGGDGRRRTRVGDPPRDVCVVERSKESWRREARGAARSPRGRATGRRRRRGAAEARAPPSRAAPRRVPPSRPRPGPDRGGGGSRARPGRRRGCVRRSGGAAHRSSPGTRTRAPPDRPRRRSSEAGARRGSVRPRRSCPGSRRPSRGRTVDLRMAPRPRLAPPVPRSRPRPSPCFRAPRGIREGTRRARPSRRGPSFGSSAFDVVRRKEGLLGADHELPDLVGESAQRQQGSVHRPSGEILIGEQLADPSELLGRGKDGRRRTRIRAARSARRRRGTRGRGS